MKVVFICHRIPYPPNKGDKIRSYNLLKYLSRHHDVYLFCLIDNPDDLRHIKPLNCLAREVHFDVIKPKSKKLTSSAALFKGLPISVRYFYSAKLQRALDNLLEKEDIGLIFCFCSSMAEYVFRSRHYQHNLKDARWIMDLVDVDSEKWRDYAKRSGWPLSLIYSMEARYLARYKAILNSAIRNHLGGFQIALRFLASQLSSFPAVPLRLTKFVCCWNFLNPLTY